MPISTIKYSAIIDAVKNYIKANCINIANFASLPDCFKQGYTYTHNISSSGGEYTSRAIFTISNYISSVSASTVDSDMTAFLTSIGITDVNANCTEQNYIAFINDMTTFCATKLTFATSQFSSNTYLVYNTDSTYMSKINISGSQTYRLAYASDTNSQFNSLFNVLKQSLRIVPCEYTITMQ